MTSESLARYHERKQDHADGFQAGWHAALQRVSEDDSVTELRDLVPDTAPAYRVERDQLAAEVERLWALLHSGAWHRRDGRTYLAIRLADGADLSCRATREDAIRAALAEAPAREEGLR